MKTNAEMITIMQAFERGEKIECQLALGGRYVVADKPLWNWASVDYRIVKIHLFELEGRLAYKGDILYSKNAVRFYKSPLTVEAAVLPYHIVVSTPGFPEVRMSIEQLTWTKPPETKSIKLFAWLDLEQELRYIKEDSGRIQPGWKRVPKLDQTVEVEI